MVEPLHVQHAAVDGGPARVAVTGEVDVATVEEFKTALAQALAAGSRVVRVDLSAVTFFDSSGLGALVQAHKQARAADQELRLAPSPAVQRVLTLTGLDRVLDVEPAAPTG